MRWKGSINLACWLSITINFILWLLLLLAGGQHFQGGILQKKTSYWYRSTNVPLPNPAPCLIVQGFSHAGAETLGRLPRGPGASLPQNKAANPKFLIIAFGFTGNYSFKHLCHELSETGCCNTWRLTHGIAEQVQLRHGHGQVSPGSGLWAVTEDCSSPLLVQCEAAWSCHGQSSLINIPAFLTHAMLNSRLTGFRLDHQRALNICLKKHLSICIDLKEAKDTRSFPAGVKQQQEEDLSKPLFRSSYTLGIHCWCVASPGLHSLPRGATGSERCRQQDRSPLGTTCDGAHWLPGAQKCVISG